MDDAATRAHPLHAARFQIAGIAEVILVAHVPVEHIGHSLEAAMRMRGEAGDIVVRIFSREMIEHQERIEAGPVRLAETALKLDAGAVRGGNGFDDALQGAGRHGRGLLNRRYGGSNADVKCCTAPLPAFTVPLGDDSIDRVAAGTGAGPYTDRLMGHALLLDRRIGASMREELGISAAMLFGAYSLALLISALTAPFVGGPSIAMAGARHERRIGLGRARAVPDRASHSTIALFSPGRSPASRWR
jgi:hypothetical protein